VEIQETVDAMVDAYAERAVAEASEFNCLLDFSQESIRELEAFLERRSHEIAERDATESCKTWGSYLGEVVRRRFGGTWTIETYPGKEFATLTLTVRGSRLFPTIKVHRRLTQGKQENIWDFYQMVASRLESVAGSRGR
jgi:hypothetical protein